MLFQTETRNNLRNGLEKLLPKLSACSSKLPPLYFTTEKFAQDGLTFVMTWRDKEQRKITQDYGLCKLAM